MRPAVFVASFYFPSLADKVQEALPDVKVINIPTVDKHTIQEKYLLKMSREAEIVFCDTLYIHYCLQEFKQLKWVQAKGAGVNSIMNLIDSANPPTFVLTRIAANSRLVGEYVMMMILARERNLYQMNDSQKTCQWRQFELACCRSLSELSIVIIGVGAMGKEIARRCKQLGMTVYGVVRSQPSPTTRCEHVDFYVHSDKMTSALEASDYVCCALPSTPETKGLFSGNVLSSCQTKMPVFINVGRGDLIDEATILTALERGWIRCAVLDVVADEPLPESSPLWTHPNVIITPHVAGYSRSKQIVDEYVREFKHNYLKHCDKEPLNNVVDFSKGY